MELQQDTPLSLPLFLLDDNIENRDIDSPDAEVSVMLSENLLAHLCQNPKEDENISLHIDDYALNNISTTVTELIGAEHQLQLLINRGPILSAVLSTSSDALFVSPPVEMMPTFDLGLDDDEDE
ncbi:MULTISPECIES: hypothetical protein [Pseudoalteromonas]|uniref:Uncharacterized protein n=1 Tax=Pseudoalteromonas piscicida TaxID=43662 RepID=A0AAD0RFS1_PSEO7|nr:MULTISPECIES: hypothetical protein [Pseudoalteromonas]ASD65743.1 hypothetical protein B1L02_00895 [Pseudoalteromonas piscicida]AXR00779.1 hypothetical protein D0511_00900 [Pseudoalteromonas piscicida]KID35807.1 hypothetical protein QT15_12705 [Pseudoalteromonas flavipulchra NCIMB 2033 = ATCC BAA-314]KJZ02447.1 hypothetical protein TW73_12565 [Pseudoalteromonas piscicida]MBD0783435.1 hypothetical protein [Pseudoalteromonas flavipulchra]